MVDNIIPKSLGVVLIIAHMGFIDCGREKVNGTLGKNITLEFKFNVNVTNTSHFIINTGLGHSNKSKVAEYKMKNSSSTDSIHIYPKNGRVFCDITNLRKNHSGLYWASLFDEPAPIQSEKVQLTVQEENGGSTVAPMQDDIQTPKDRGSSRSSHILMTVLVVSPVVLAAAALTWLIWSLVRSKDKKEQSPQQNSNPTIQETVEASNSVSAASLVYSVLDFPKRASAVVEIDSSDTEYAAVSYHPKNRGK